MKKGLIVLGLIIVMVFVSCSRWPSVVIGDSSGYLQYNRSTGILEILWEKHVQVKDSSLTKSLPDSVLSSKDICL